MIFSNSRFCVNFKSFNLILYFKRELAIIKFSEDSGLSIPDIATMAKEEEKPNGVIDQYKTGKITTEEFRTEINKLIENAGGTPITNLETFDKC
ncbi:hypothetical protein [Rickettsia tamurae]|uniref:hypothetical protein n=2 Tax=Rickettsia tamurae TaxID=334545 RepID=UPI001F26A2E9|nr:hypothetical protein [Rickettsia tamurae]